MSLYYLCLEYLSLSYCSEFQLYPRPTALPTLDASVLNQQHHCIPRQRYLLHVCEWHFVNGSGAAELLHFGVGATQLEGEGAVSEGVGGKSRETAKTRARGRKRGKDADRRTAGEAEQKGWPPSIGRDNFPLIAALFGDCWREVIAHTLQLGRRP